MFYLIQKSKHHFISTPCRLVILFLIILYSCGPKKIDCEQCEMTGKVVCEQCEGKGKEECTGCAGSGENYCYDCSGRGREECTWCYGHGEENCSYCYGNGKNLSGELCFHVVAQVKKNVFLV
jgi:hypothetical protein